MNLQEIFTLAAAILGSVGSASLLIFGLSSWLGKVWASRILQKDKLKYQSELEIIKTQLQSESQKQNLMFSMYFQGQFKLYNDLWVSLSELQSGVDALWSEANTKNLKSFVAAVRSAKKQIRDSALLIEPEHYNDIMNAIKAFEQYRYGKEELIFARKDLATVDNWEIREIINQNRENRESITAFVNLMLDKMRTQIGGAINNQITRS
jgi:hypothetical protein